MNYFVRAVNANKGAVSIRALRTGFLEGFAAVFPADGAEAAFDKTPLRQPPHGGSPRAELRREDPSADIRQTAHGATAEGTLYFLL